MGGITPKNAPPFKSKHINGAGSDDIEDDIDGYDGTMNGDEDEDDDYDDNDFDEEEEEQFKKTAAEFAKKLK